MKPLRPVVFAAILFWLHWVHITRRTSEFSADLLRAPINDILVNVSISSTATPVDAREQSDQSSINFNNGTVVNDQKKIFTTQVPSFTSLPSHKSAKAAIKAAELPIAKRYDAALRELHHLLHPESCQDRKAIVVMLGRGGGLGSQMQMVAKIFGAAVKEAAATGEIVLLKGHLKAYTKNAECSEFARKDSYNDPGWSCFFEPVSNCSTNSKGPYAVTIKRRHPWNTHSGTGQQLFPHRPREPRKLTSKAFDDLSTGMKDAVLPAFASESPAFWWGCLQGYISRLNSRMRDRLRSLKLELFWDHGPMGPPPVVSVHLRMGDKLTDVQSRQTIFPSSSFVAKGRAPADYFRQALLLVRMIRKGSRCIFHETSPDLPPTGALVATDSFEGAKAAKQWAQETPEVRLLIARRTTVSQTLAENGKEVRYELGKHRDLAYTAAEEVVLDLNLLQATPYFVGICMSQLARQVVEIGAARGTLQVAVAMDYENLRFSGEMELGKSHGLPWRAPLLNSSG